LLEEVCFVCVYVMLGVEFSIGLMCFVEWRRWLASFAEFNYYYSCDNQVIKEQNLRFRHLKTADDLGRKWANIWEKLLQKDDPVEEISNK